MSNNCRNNKENIIDSLIVKSNLKITAKNTYYKNENDEFIEPIAMLLLEKIILKIKLENQ